MKTLKCSCGKTAKYKDTNSVGSILKQTGFRATMTYLGKFIYLCPKCFKEAQEHAEAIMKIVGSSYLYFPNLLKKDTLKKEEEKK